MTEMGISLPRSEYIAGETIIGSVTLKCEEFIKFEYLTITLNGTVVYVYSEIKVSGKAKVRSETKTAQWHIHQDSFFSGRDIAYDAGTYTIPFQFQLPADLIPSRLRGNFQIIYYITSVIKRSRKKPVASVEKFTIVQPINDSISEEVKATNHERSRELEIQMDSNRHIQGEGLSFSYKIDTDEKFKELRVEIEEDYRWKGIKKDMQNRSARNIRSIPYEKVTKNEWKKLTILLPESTNPSVSHSSFDCNQILKVTLVRRFAVDATARIPLVVGHSIGPEWTSKRERAKLSVSLERIEVSEKQLSDKERLAIHWYNKAISFREEKLEKEALKCIEKSLGLNPELEEAIALKEVLTDETN